MAGAMIAGRAVGAAGELQSAEARAKAKEFEADQAEVEKRIVKARGRFEQARLAEEARRFKGAQRAAIGASGTTFEGSPLLMIAEAAEDFELERQVIEYETAIGVNAARDRRSLRLYEARQERAAGHFAAASTMLGG